MQTPQRNYPAIARKMSGVLFTVQSLNSAALIVAATINAIAGDELTGNPAMAGVPGAVLQLGSAFAAMAGGWAMETFGRRYGLGGGMLIGVLGSAVATWGIIQSSFLIFLIGLVIVGVGRAASQLSRFTAAEVRPPAERGRAISYVVFGGTVGAVFGPLLVGPAGVWAETLGFNELVGPYLIATLILALAAGILLALLTPEPREIAREIATLYPEKALSSVTERPLQNIFRDKTVITAVTSMVIGQVVMVAIMVITSLHMRQYQHSLSQIALVISSHTIGMFAFSIITGWLTDEWGRYPVLMSGVLLMLLSCILAPLSPQVTPLATALFLLGLGWNFTYVGGSALLSDALSPEERAKTQGVNDWLMGLATAAASFFGGIIFAVYGYTWLAILGAVLSVVLGGVLIWWRWNTTRSPI